jgi:hypothetical protein
MAHQARYTETVGPVTTTPDQRSAVVAEADERGVSVSVVVRDALDVRYGLVSGKRPETAPEG